MTATFFGAGCATTPSGGMPSGEPSATDAAVVHEKDGIRIKGLWWSADGTLIDVRYEITDPERAAKVLTSDVKPFLKDESTGVVLEVPNMAKVGRLQQTTNPPEPGRVYFMFFGNNRLIQRGKPVTLILGETTFEGLVVE